MKSFITSPIIFLLLLPILHGFKPIERKSNGKINHNGAVTSRRLTNVSGDAQRTRMIPESATRMTKKDKSKKKKKTPVTSAPTARKVDAMKTKAPKATKAPNGKVEAILNDDGVVSDDSIAPIIGTPSPVKGTCDDEDSLVEVSSVTNVEDSLYFSISLINVKSI